MGNKPEYDHRMDVFRYAVVGSLERPGGRDDDAYALQAPARCPEPPGHSIDSAYNRMRAEEFGDLAVEMIAEGIDGTAYGAARKAAHHGAIALALYQERALRRPARGWGVIEALPTVAHCESCGRGFLWNKRGDRCPACDGIVSESAPCGGPPRCPAQWHEPCLCMVGWRHCPIHQDEGRGEEKL